MIDADGFRFIRGRADGAIIRGGFKLLRETMERGLLLHDAVSSAAVIDLPDHRLGQVPAVAIEPATGNRHELEAHLRRHLPATHIPVHRRFVAELPRTTSMNSIAAQSSACS